MRKRLKSERGVLSLEATLVVTLLSFVIMIIMNIGHVYQAQNRVYHGMIQAAKTIGVESFEVNETSGTATEEALSQILLLFENLGLKKASQKDRFHHAIKNNSNAGEAARIAFVNSVSIGETQANTSLKAYGIDGGAAGMDFQDSEFKDGDIKVVVTYKINLILPVFGVESVTLKQSTLAKMWGQ